jgi:spore maturation protein CgeB
MKILIPAPELPDAFAHNVAHTLRRMGHEVLTAPLTRATLLPRLRTTAFELWAKASPNATTAAERWAVNAARTFRPTMVLAVTQQLTQESLDAFHEYGARYCVSWWGDPPANMRRLGLLPTGWDALFLKDRGAVEKLRRVGRRAYVLHEAMNPDWHKPVATASNQETVIVGAWYAYRQALANRLLDEGIAVRGHGPRLPFWQLPRISRLEIGPYVAMLEKSRVFGEALVCLNHSDFAEGDSLNCRAFEIAGAGGLHVAEFRPSLTECFEPGKELLTFREFDELLAHIEWAMRCPAEATAMRAAAAARAAAEHTYAHRLTTIFETLGERASS